MARSASSPAPALVTTTITHRIAHQVGTEAFHPGEILAVTFTDKAAGELRARLERLGAPGVTARTFHAAALAQLRLAPERVGKLVPSKALPLRHRPVATRRLPLPSARRHRHRDRVGKEPPHHARALPRELGDHEPPLPADLMHRVYVRYEEGKHAKGFVDFEDLLELAIRTYEEDDRALAIFRERYRAFTVDEYQDVNLLQQTLLDLWLGARDDLCVVGDDYQSIYAFGASPEHLLGMPSRFPNATVVRLEQELPFDAPGAEAREPPRAQARRRREDPARDATGRARARAGAGVGRGRVRRRANPCARRAARGDRDSLPHERTPDRLRERARSRGIPHQGSSFLARDAARFVLRKLDSPADVRRLALDAGWQESEHNGLGERELVRQRDLGRLVGLAEELAELDGPAFVAELERRFGDGGESRRGVHLLTLHGAGGSSSRPSSSRTSRARATRAAGEDRGGSDRGTAPPLRRPHARTAAPLGDVGTAPVAVPCGARGRERARRRSPSQATPCTRRSSAGASSVRRRTGCRHTSSSTTRPWRRSPRAGRAR